jgi:hypothetical protein
MHRTPAIFSSLVAVACAIGAMGCSSTSSPAGMGDGTCAPNTNVSFKTDVIPVFQQSCTLSSECHGQMNNVPEESLYLGENAGGTNAGTVYSMIVGVPAKEIPSMNLVTAGDLDNSYLWHKINDSMTDLQNLGSQCMMAPTACSDCRTGQPCGSTMPYPSGTIDPTFACTIQNWISNGAQNN